jgi:hypothetical protein
LALAYGGRAKLSFRGDRERTLTCVAVPSLSSAELA